MFEGEECQRLKDYTYGSLRLCVISSSTLNVLEARIRLEIEIGSEFNRSEERKPISSLVNFASRAIGQNPIESQS